MAIYALMEEEEMATSHVLPSYKVVGQDVMGLGIKLHSGDIMFSRPREGI